MERPPLIVVEDPANRRAIVEHHGAGRIDHGRRRFCYGCRVDGFRSLRRAVTLGLGLLPPEHGLLDLPQATHLLPHLNLGMGARLRTDPRPELLIFGTGWGLTREILDRCDDLLEPVRGTGEYNHLSVRSAASIILDRLRNGR